MDYCFTETSKEYVHSVTAKIFSLARTNSRIKVWRLVKSHKHLESLLNIYDYISEKI